MAESHRAEGCGLVRSNTAARHAQRQDVEARQQMLVASSMASPWHFHVAWVPFMRCRIPGRAL